MPDLGFLVISGVSSVLRPERVVVVDFIYFIFFVQMKVELCHIGVMISLHL